jgi:hypothetical protein
MDKRFAHFSFLLHALCLHRATFIPYLDLSDVISGREITEVYQVTSNWFPFSGALVVQVLITSITSKIFWSFKTVTFWQLAWL